MRTKATIIAAAAAGALLLAGCSSGSSSASDASGAATAECTTDVLQPAVNDQADALGRGNTMPIADLQCADGWAVATGTMVPKNEPGTFIFQAQGSTWIWQEPMTVCGKTAEKSSVPESLFPVACGS